MRGYVDRLMDGWWRDQGKPTWTSAAADGRWGSEGRVVGLFLLFFLLYFLSFFGE